MPAVHPRQHASPRRRGPLTDDVHHDTKCFRARSGVIAMATCSNSTIWLAMQDGRVEVRDVHTGQTVHEFAVTGVRQRCSKVWCMLAIFDVLNSEAQLWMGLSSGAIEVYTEAYQLRRQLSKHLSGVYCLAEYRGAVAYAGSSDFTITQWRVSDGQLLRVMTGHSNYVRCLYAEGNALVSGSDDNSIRVWDVASGAALQQYAHLHRESGGVSTLCRVGTAMWSGDHSGAIAVWRLKDGAALLVSRQLSGRITSLRKVGARVYAGDSDGRICVFNASDCTVVSRLDDHCGSHISALTCAVEVNRYFVWSGSADNTIRCWHHDEHQPVTAEREGFLDMRWYYTTQQPYLHANDELLEQQRELTELIVLSNGSDEAVRGFLDDYEDGRETAAARYWLLDGKLKQSQSRCDKAEEEARAIEATMERKTQSLELLRQQLASLTEALQKARLSAPPPPVPGALQMLPPSAPPLVPGLSSVPPPPLGSLPLPGGASLPPLPPSMQLPAAPGGTPLSIPPGTAPLPSLPPAAVPLPPPSSTFTSTLPTASMPPPPPPPAAVPPPPPSVIVPVPSSVAGPSSGPLSDAPLSAASPPPPRVITETQVTLSRSFEPVLSALPPPPSAAAPKRTMGSLLRMSTSVTVPSSTTVVVPPAPSVAVPPPPPGVAVPSRPAEARTLDDAPIPKPAAPRARRMSF